ncbi:MAG: MraY family glycosyltransferase [Myxococcota bacterium]
MLTASIAFLISLITVLALTPVVRFLAMRLGAIDSGANSGRKVHREPIPRLGGVAIAAGFFLPLLGLTFVDSEVGRIFTSDATKVWGLFAGGAAIIALGVFDDISGANAKQKFLVQIAVATALYFLGFKIGAISTPFDFRLELGVVSYLTTVVWIVGVINAMNLIDGLDGLAAGVALVASIGTFIAAVLNGNVLMMLFMSALSGSLLSFLVFNFNPARIFMGDTGSMFLGYILAVTSVQTNTKGAATVAFLIPVLAVGLPIMDTFLAMGRRAYRGRPMFAADKEHLHHQLLELGLSHRAAVFVLWGMAALLGTAALLVSQLTGVYAALVLVIAAVAVALFLAWLGYMRPKPSELANEITDADYRRLNSEFRKLRRELAQSLAKERSIPQAWATFTDILAAVDAPSLHLWIHFADPSVTPATREFDAGPRPDTDTQHCRRYLLRFDLEHAGMLEVAWNKAHEKLTVDQEYGVKRLVDIFEGTLRRILVEPSGAELIRIPDRVRGKSL